MPHVIIYKLDNNTEYLSKDYSLLITIKFIRNKIMLITINQ